MAPRGIEGNMKALSEAEIRPVAVTVDKPEVLEAAKALP
jgi:hypothetical protein